MRKIEVIITPMREDHFAKHNIRKRELLQILRRPYFLKRVGSRFELYGKTDGGRYLTAILEKIKGNLFFVITARDSTKPEKALYQKKVN